MGNQTLPYLIPYIVSLVITCSVGIFALRRRKVAGALPFALAAFGQVQWTLGYIFELLSPGLQAKIFWDNFQLFGGLVYALGVLVFARRYTGRQFSNPKRAWSLLTIIPA
ncbi:MAG: hypothetical protein JXA78_10380, partial [Anaerolineales bacterium]|nr:hypothetical protein [Anaerolineales bacterium]